MSDLCLSLGISDNDYWNFKYDNVYSLIIITVPSGFNIETFLYDNILIAVKSFSRSMWLFIQVIPIKDKNNFK